MLVKSICSDLVEPLKSMRGIEEDAQWQEVDGVEVKEIDVLERKERENSAFNKMMSIYTCMHAHDLPSS